jgi:hypothetical protein
MTASYLGGEASFKRPGATWEYLQDPSALMTSVNRALLRMLAARALQGPEAQ